MLIADDDADWHYIFARVLESECDVIGHVEHGNEVVAAAVRLQPDVVTLDVSMPGPSGVRVLPKLREALPEAILMINISGSNGQTEAGQISKRSLHLEGLAVRLFEPVVPRSVHRRSLDREMASQSLEHHQSRPAACASHTQ